MLFFRTTRILPLLLLRSSRLLFPSSLTPRCCCCCCLRRRLLLPRRQRRRERIERALMSRVVFSNAFYLCNCFFCSPLSKNVHYFFSLGFILSFQFRVYGKKSTERFFWGDIFDTKKRALSSRLTIERLARLKTLLRCCSCCYHQHHHVVDSADARKIVVFFSG